MARAPHPPSAPSPHVVGRRGVNFDLGGVSGLFEAATCSTSRSNQRLALIVESTIRAIPLALTPDRKFTPLLPTTWGEGAQGG